jgi:hypothetical protein
MKGGASMFDRWILWAVLIDIFLVACTERVIYNSAKDSDMPPVDAVDVSNYIACAKHCPANSICSGDVCHSVECTGASLEEPVWGYVVFDTMIDLDGCPEKPSGRDVSPISSEWGSAAAIIPFAKDEQGVAQGLALVGVTPGGCGSDATDGTTEWHLTSESFIDFHGANCLERAGQVLSRVEKGQVGKYSKLSDRLSMPVTFASFNFSSSQISCQPIISWLVYVLEIDNIWASELPVSGSPTTWPDTVEAVVCGKVDVAKTLQISPEMSHILTSEIEPYIPKWRVQLKKRKFVSITSYCTRATNWPIDCYGSSN